MKPLRRVILGGFPSSFCKNGVRNCYPLVQSFISIKEIALTRLVSATKHENRDAMAIFSQSHLSLPDLTEMWVTLARSMAELSPLLKVVLTYLDMVVPSPVLKGGFSITIYLFGGKPLQGQK